MNRIYKILIIFLLFLINPFDSLSGEILFHSDKYCYTTGETMSFSIYNTGTDSLKSNSLFYIQLLKYNAKNGIPDLITGTKFIFTGQFFNGSLRFNDTLSSGNYLFLGFNQEYLITRAPAFVQSIFIYNPNYSYTEFELESPLSINIFPEGGNIVAGFPCKFKYVLNFFDSARLNDAWISSGDSELVHIRPSGQGIFDFTPLEGQQYFMNVKYNNDVYKKTIEPAVLAGYNLRVESIQTGIAFVHLYGRNNGKTDFILLAVNSPDSVFKKVVITPPGILDSTYRISLKNLSGPIRLSLQGIQDIISSRWIYMPFEEQGRIEYSHFNEKSGPGQDVSIKGIIHTKMLSGKISHISASLVKSSFAVLDNFLWLNHRNYSQWELFNDFCKSSALSFNDLLIGYQDEEQLIRTDSSIIKLFISKDLLGLAGKIFSNDNIEPLKMMYLVAKGKDIYIDSYLSTLKGEFKFSIKNLQSFHEYDIITRSNDLKNYSIQLYGNVTETTPFVFSNSSSIKISNSFSYISYVKKNLWISNSYRSNKIINNADSVAENYFYGEPYKRIFPDQYINFPTFPEVIREIVPIVSIGYKKGIYYSRMRDIRAKNYCCTGDPLYFVNDDPYLDNQPVMELNPQIIEFIDVIRPVEAIGQFGEIGRNGIISIHLNNGNTLKSGSGSQKKKIQFPSIENKSEENIVPLPENYPDFREQLFWKNDISIQNNQSFSIDFRTSYLEGDYYLIINGIDSEGQPIIDLKKITVSSVK